MPDGMENLMPSATLPSRYLKLLHRFPLRPIRSDEELDRAIAVSMDLDARREGLSLGERDYHEVLVTLIAKYEDQQHPIPDVSGPEMLRCLIENRGVTQAAVARGTGIGESALSEILAGRRPMGRKTIQSLARYFHVEPGLLLVADAGDGP
jgi:HTH-type transcriptional regulator/antitoxin HigA